MMAQLKGGALIKSLNDFILDSVDISIILTHVPDNLQFYRNP